MSGQRYAIIPQAALIDKRLSPRDITVLCALGQHTDEHGWCHPSQTRIGNMLGVSRQMVGKAIAKLRQCGYIEVRARRNSDGGQTSNAMRVVMDTSTRAEHLRTPATTGCTPATPEVAPPATPEVAPPATPEVARTTPLNDPIERVARNPASPDGASGHSLENKKPKSAVSIDTWLKSTKAAGELPIPADDPVFDYADKAGIPVDMVHLAWCEFQVRNRERGKRYRDWRQAFRNCVRGSWYGLWYAQPDGDYALTTRGRQAQLVHDQQMEVAA